MGSTGERSSAMKDSLSVRSSNPTILLLPPQPPLKHRAHTAFYSRLLNNPITQGNIILLKGEKFKCYIQLRQALLE